MSLDFGRCGFTVDDGITVPDIEHLLCLCRYVCSGIERKGPSRKDGLSNADFADNATSFLPSRAYHSTTADYAQGR